MTLEHAVAAIKKNTWHYAKRQMTWFRKTANVRWVNSEEKALLLTKTFLTKKQAPNDNGAQAITGRKSACK